MMTVALEGYVQSKEYEGQEIVSSQCIQEMALNWRPAIFNTAEKKRFLKLKLGIATKLLNSFKNCSKQGLSQISNPSLLFYMLHLYCVLDIIHKASKI